MATHDFLPRAFGALVFWIGNFMTYLKANMARFGISDEETTDLATATNNFITANAKADAPNAGKADRFDRAEKAKTASKVIRDFVNTFLRFNRAVTDDDRVQLGLNVPDPKPTPAPVPSSYPDIDPDTSIILRITIHYHDAGSTSRAKPAGVHGAEIRWAILDKPPVETDDLIHSTFSTHTPRTFEFKESERGKTVYFRLCWENTRGQKGPWSEIVSSIVP
jgi:hypothetical protein